MGHNGVPGTPRIASFPGTRGGLRFGFRTLSLLLPLSLSLSIPRAFSAAPAPPSGRTAPEGTT